MAIRQKEKNHYKKMPASVTTKQVKKSTVEYFRVNVKKYSVPKEIIFDNYRPTTSKSN